MSKNSQDYKTPDERTQELLRSTEDTLNKTGKTWDELAEVWRSSKGDRDEGKQNLLNQGFQILD
jgi:hypothetical protein